MKTISSQRHIDESIVEQKIANEDYDVMVSPEFVHDDTTMRIVIDGHHSLAAAQATGNAPNFVEATSQNSDSIGILLRGEIDYFLAINRIDANYYDIETGKDIW